MASLKTILTGAAAILSAIFYFLLPAPPPFDPAAIRGQHVLITGASTGIGEQLAYAYSRLGARLWLSARRQAVLDEVAAKCRNLGATDVRVVAGDMSEPQDRARLIADVENNGGRLDQLLLNHVAIHEFGFWLGSDNNMTGLRKDLELNFVAYVDLASRATPLLEASSGRLGVVSSVAGKVGSPQLASYSADKFALQGFFSSLRHEWHHRRVGATVTLCVLGLISTDSALGIVKDKWLLSMAADPGETATAIMEAVSRGVREMRYPFKQTFILPWLSVLPDIVGDLVARVGLPAAD